jgi:orotidine-5'-phosphate decarboxylase
MTHAEQPHTAVDIARERLIVALDVSTANDAERIVSNLRDTVGMFKVGLQLFSAVGPKLVRELVQSGEKIFLDLKFHDIPNTVAAAGVEATHLGVSMFNVHAAGGLEMMRRTVAAVSEVVVKEGLSKPKVIAVTVLTSADDSTLRETGISSGSFEQVERLAVLTERAGLDGVVASPQEVQLVRQSVKRDFLLVTPGVRPAGTDRNDQRRTMSPREAMAAGADYLVVGRPITSADNPRIAAEIIVSEMAEGLQNG